MPNDTSLALLQKQYRERWQHTDWQEFREHRPKWNRVKERRQDDELDILLEQYAVDANVQSPLLEAEHADVVAVMRGNDIKFDMLSLDTGEKAKERVEDLRIYAAGRHMQEDEAQQFSGEIFEDLAFPYGVWVGFKTWKMVMEPEKGEQGEDEDDDAYARRTDKERRDHYGNQDMASIFGREHVNPLEMAWFPYRQPTWFMQVSEISYLEARELKQYKLPDKPFRILKNNAAFHFGETEPTDEVDYESSDTAPKLKRIRRAMLDKDSGKWHVTEWICEGDPANEMKGDVLDDYECPFGRSPYFICASGNSFKNASTPHLMFRPWLYKLYVKVKELNTWDSLLAKATIWRLQHPYTYTLNGVPKENVDRWIEGMRGAGFDVQEGVGAEATYFVRPQQLAAGEIAVAPNIQTIPSDDIATLLEKRQHVLNEINEMRSNPLLLGEADIEGPPATSVLSQQQAARTTWGPMYANVAHLHKEWREAEFNAICYWEEGTGEEYRREQKLYRYPVRGDEPTGETQKPREAGDVIEITAETVKAQRYVLTVTIANETDQERAMNEDRADDAYWNKRALSREQWLKRRGFDDPKKQAAILEEREREEHQRAYWLNWSQQNVKQLVAIQSGISPAAMPPTAEEAAMAASQPAPVAPSAPKPGVMNGTAPLVEGPSGSSNPMAGSAA